MTCCVVLRCVVLCCVVFVVLGRFVDSFFHRFWSSWGSFGVILGRLGGRFRPLGVVLGRSWAVLGHLGAVLGAVDDQGWHQPDFALYLGSFLDPSWVPKRGQDGAQNDPKSIKKSS